MQRILLTIFLFTYSLLGLAKPIPASQAFQLNVSISHQQILAHFHIAPGYHLYRDRLNVSAEQLSLSKMQIPAGETQDNEVLGHYQVLSGDFTIIIPYRYTEPMETPILLGYQGCANDGFCYPPIAKRILLQVSAVGEQVVEIQDAEPSLTKPNPPVTNKFDTTFQQHNIFYILVTFLLLGLLLSFTPCVLPMLPIVSSIIADQRHLTSWKGFTLTATYVLGMALTYAILGVITSLIGANLSVFFQSRWVLMLFAAIFVVLSISMFGAFDLQLPSSWQQKLVNLRQQQRGGTYLGVFFMSIFATLILSPCVTAPLVGALTYISQTGNVLLGGSALFFLGLGMGTPLLIIGIAGGKWLPTTGAWMVRIKQICGFLLLTVAIDLLSRLFSPIMITSLWLLLASSFIIYCLFIKGWLSKIIAIVSLILVSYLSMPYFYHHKTTSPIIFQPIKSYSDLQQALRRNPGKLVLVDFYADWCISCQIMDKTVFSDAQVKQALQAYLLLRANVSNNDPVDQDLQKHLHVFAPPTIIFFGPDGKELSQYRLIGEANKEKFLSKLATIQ